MGEKEMEFYMDIMRKCSINTETITWSGLENIAKAMESYHEAKLKLLGIGDGLDLKCPPYDRCKKICDECAFTTGLKPY